MYFLEVSPGFIDTMRIRLLAGRDLVRGDFAPGSASVLVNETFARLFLPGPSPLGRKFTRPERASRDSPEEEVPHEVVRGVVAGIVGYVALGTVAGLAAGLWLSRFVTWLLYESHPSDPSSILLPLGLLLLVATVASVLPARRAATVDPMVALRDE